MVILKCRKVQVLLYKFAQHTTVLSNAPILSSLKRRKDPAEYPKSDGNITMTTNSMVDSHTSRMSEMYDYYKYSSRIERPGDPADRLSFGRYIGKFDYKYSSWIEPAQMDRLSFGRYIGKFQCKYSSWIEPVQMDRLLFGRYIGKFHCKYNSRIKPVQVDRLS